MSKPFGEINGRLVHYYCIIFRKQVGLPFKGLLLAKPFNATNQFVVMMLVLNVWNGDEEGSNVDWIIVSVRIPCGFVNAGSFKANK